MRIAINGCGIAGPTLAWWLRQHGFEPVLFERAPALRSGGYVIDFWGFGYDIAERMGILPALSSDGYVAERLRTLTPRGKEVVEVRGDIFTTLTGGRYLTVARSALAHHLWSACEGIEAHFGRSITGLTDGPGGVDVTLSDGGRERFDLVIGADGLHSQVRGLVFGAESQFERFAGSYAVAFTLPGYRPRDELTYVMWGWPGLQIARFALRGDETLFLFTFDGRSVDAVPDGVPAQKELLRRITAGKEGEVTAIMDRLDEVSNLYFDRMSQIRMPGWSRGRVALVGDAVACASLLAGEGSSLGMAEAYVLAGELRRAEGDHVAAFAAWESRLRPMVEKKQDDALKFARYFVPRTRLSLFLRDLGTRLASVPFIARRALAPMFRPPITLPEY
ncbi:MAG: FAD-binding domain [Nannocystaceae bacterium]